MSQMNQEKRIQNKLYLNDMENVPAAREVLIMALQRGWNIERIILILTPNGVTAIKQ